MACGRIIVSAPVPVPFLWTLDLGFGTWAWDLDLRLGFGTWIWVLDLEDLDFGLDLGLTIISGSRVQLSRMYLFLGREKFWLSFGLVFTVS